MKTAISLPDGIFDRATRRAKDLGVSRSEFFARAASNYLEQLDAHSVTRQLNDALEVIGSDDSQLLAVEAGHRVLFDESDEW